jgi:hypothetical protein
VGHIKVESQTRLPLIVGTNQLGVRHFSLFEKWRTQQSTGSAGILPAVARASCPRRRLSSIRAGFGKATILGVPRTFQKDAAL